MGLPPVLLPCPALSPVHLLTPFSRPHLIRFVFTGATPILMQFSAFPIAWEVCLTWVALQETHSLRPASETGDRKD